MEWTLFIGFCFALLTIFILKSIRVYKTYEGKVYKYIYSGFLEYYIKFKYKKNLSESHWLNQEIGFHRILFNNYLNDKQESVYEIITIFHQKGITIFSILNNVGSINGNLKDKNWIIRHDNKNYRIKNPFLILNQHKNYISSQIENDQIIDAFVLISPQSSCTINSVISLDQIITTLKNGKHNLDENQIKDLYAIMINRG